MKKILIALGLISSVQAQASFIRGGQFLADENAILLSIQYNGGCQTHTFELQDQGCAERLPVACTLVLVDTTEEVDLCEARPIKQVKFSLDQIGYTGKYYSNASVRVKGAGNTFVDLKLPEMDDRVVSQEPQEQDNRCAEKQKYAARVQFSHNLGIALNKVKVVSYEPGAWSEAVGNNHGADYVTVNSGSATVTYRVSAKQIGTSDDCNVLKVEVN